MTEIRIDIRHDDFIGEYYADIRLAHNKIEYISSNDLKTLLLHITDIVIKDKSA